MAFASSLFRLPLRRLLRWDSAQNKEVCTHHSHKGVLRCVINGARPQVGVSSAIFQLDSSGKLSETDWSVLLVQRGKPPAEGLWSLPGGSLNFGEKLIDGAMREIEEETGLGVRDVQLAGRPFMAVDRIDHDAGSHFVVVQCIGFARWGSRPAAGDDARNAKFVDGNELKVVTKGGEAGTDDLEEIIRYAHQLIVSGNISDPEKVSPLH